MIKSQSKALVKYQAKTIKKYAVIDKKAKFNSVLSLHKENDKTVIDLLEKVKSAGSSINGYILGLIKKDQIRNGVEDLNIKTHIQSLRQSDLFFSFNAYIKKLILGDQANNN